MSEIFEVKSSNVVSFEYFDDERLRATFKHGGVYEYEGVPREVLDAVLESESIGSAFHSTIRSSYPFQKIEE